MTSRKRWADLSVGQRVGALVMTIIQFALLIAAQRDIGRRRDEELNGSKAMWRAITLVNYIGPIAYFLLGVKREETPEVAEV